MKVKFHSLLCGARVAQGCVIIIDVFRAFTTAAIAFERGASQIYLAETVSDALDLRSRGLGSICVGERNGVRPDEFEFGNSPRQMQLATVRDQTLIQTTTNGTAGIFAARKAQQIFAASFVCADATISAIKRLMPEHVSVVAIGRRGIRADEDELCALYLRSRLEGRDPDREALRVLASTIVPKPAPELIANGNYDTADRDLALSISSIPLAMKVESVDGLIALRPVPQQPNGGSV